MTHTAPAPVQVDDTRQMYSALNPAYPRSWWTIAWSDDVAVGKVVPARVLERDVVLWRDSAGNLHCMAGHCAHLGAPLGVGGAVVKDELQCPFHGWRYGTTGELSAITGPGRVRKGICLPSYRVIERYGAVFLWNGADEPDIEFPDLLAELGLREDEVVFCKRRSFTPYAARYLAENTADGAHFAFTHDTQGWTESVIIEDTSTVLRLETRIHDTPKWWTWRHLVRCIGQREFSAMLATIGGLSIDSYGATLFRIRVSARDSIMGNTLVCFTPVDEKSHCMMDLMLMPRIRVPLIGLLVQRVTNFILGGMTWNIVRQDFPIMMRRREPANPPYASSDKPLIVFRRLWDSRINADRPLDGESLRHSGLRAGIRPARKAIEVPAPDAVACAAPVNANPAANEVGR